MSDHLLIGGLAKRVGINPQTIRYYEEPGVLPPPERLPNGYRVYREEDEARLCFVRGARSLGFKLEDIAEILAFRDRSEAPCRYVIRLLREKINEIDIRLVELEQLQDDVNNLIEAAAHLPLDDVEMKTCVCHLIRNRTDKSSDLRPLWLCCWVLSV